MKKLLLILTLCVLTIFVNGQNKTDTTKKQPVYFLTGTLPDFQLLFKAIEKPEEITRGQVNALIAWINTLRVIPEEKPKKQ